MNEFRLFWQQLNDRASNFRWNVQAVAIVLLLGLGLGGLFAVRSEPPTAHGPLFPDRTLSPAEVQQVDRALSTSGHTDYRIESGQVMVPAAERPAYIAAVHAGRGMPATFYAATDEAMRKNSILELPHQQRQRREHAKQKDARLTICALEGVENAFVHFDTSTQNWPTGKTVTAVVGVQTVPGHPLSPRTVRVIQDMMLGLKYGLSVENLTVTDLTVGRSVRGSIQQYDPVMLQEWQREEVQRRWRARLLPAVAFVPGADLSVQAVSSTQQTSATATPHTTPRPTDRLRILVQVPASYLNQLAQLRQDQESLDFAALSAMAREQIQNALTQHLPPAATGQPTAELVMNIVPVQPTADTAPTAWWKPWLESQWSLLAAGATALFALAWVTRRPPSSPADSGPQLRVVGAADQSEHDLPETHTSARDAAEQSADTELQTRLRAFVADDPDAAAKSLTDMIDRAS